jgi:hypothetical protein
MVAAVLEEGRMLVFVGAQVTFCSASVDVGESPGTSWGLPLVARLQVRPAESVNGALFAAGR